MGRKREEEEGEVVERTEVKHIGEENHESDKKISSQKRKLSRMNARQTVPQLFSSANHIFIKA